MHTTKEKVSTLQLILGVEVFCEVFTELVESISCPVRHFIVFSFNTAAIQGVHVLF